MEHNANHIILSFCHLPVSCRILVDQCGSLGDCKLQIFFSQKRVSSVQRNGLWYIRLLDPRKLRNLIWQTCKWLYFKIQWFFFFNHASFLLFQSHGPLYRNALPFLMFLYNIIFCCWGVLSILNVCSFLFDLCRLISCNNPCSMPNFCWEKIYLFNWSWSYFIAIFILFHQMI